jgi:hypothetical protein
MEPFQVNILFQFARALQNFQRDAATLQGNVTQHDKNALGPVLTLCDRTTEFFWLPAAAARRYRITRDLDANCSYSDLRTQLQTLTETIEDELATRMVLFMPAKRAVHYVANEKLLGQDVLMKFPSLAGDIDEAGKCLGTGRFTAAVFHLMRVMEVGVQQFGTALGVTFTGTKVWQVILDQVNAAIKRLDTRDPKTATLSGLAANLYAVKLAWRNEVMHPKATYTEDEATRVLDATRAFMAELAETISP